MNNTNIQKLLEEAEKKDECAKKFSDFPYPIVEGLVEADMGEVVPGYSLVDYFEAEKVEESKKNKKEEPKPEEA